MPIYFIKILLIETSTWNDRNTDLIGENQLGLAWYTFQLPSKDVFKLFVKHLDEAAVKYVNENEQIMIQDPNGMQIKFGD